MSVALPGQRSAVKHRSLRCFVETLQEAGLEDRVAKAISTAVRESHQGADFATKADLREMELRSEAKFERLDAKLGSLRAELNLIKWMMGMTLAAVLSMFFRSFF